MLQTIKNSKLWNAIEEGSNKASDGDRASILALTEYAGDFLDRIIETFPNYTWHNRRHALNVVQIMDDLLGDFVPRLQPMECALLLICAFMHDIGMALTPNERELLFETHDFKKVPDFNHFRHQRPETDLILLKLERDALGKQTSADANHKLRAIALDYCRWAHASRVDVYLRDIRRQHPDWLSFDGKSLEQAIQLVCVSHNWDAAGLRQTANGATLKLNINYAGKADLLFCAILLRLADIMDFDHTRTPEHLYRFLDISSEHEPISDLEWRKHMSAEGFVFPLPADRDPHYMVTFSGEFEKPEIEVAVNRFLEVIKQEIDACRIVLTSCSSRKRELRLPDGIDNQAEPVGFMSGGYRFEVDERSVIELLMGENLYDDKYVFVRELVQNAIDTVRHRSFSIPSDKIDYRVEVSEFADASTGTRWVRFDDNGMGMDENIIRKYLLRIGKSYYRSADFELDTLRIAEKTGHINLVPISRFGIGILSCFIRGDRIEISTTRHESDGLRLRLLGLDAFHFLHSEKAEHKEPAPMPQRGGREDGYRLERGTSVAVRLNPRINHNDFNLRHSLERYILFPSVPVVFEDEAIGGSFREIIERPWIERIAVELTSEEMGKIEEILDYKFSEPLRLVLQPLDLTQASPRRQELAGQAVISVIEMSELDRENIWQGDVTRDIYIVWNLYESAGADAELKAPELQLRYKNPAKRTQADEQISRLEAEYAQIVGKFANFDYRAKSLGFRYELGRLTVYVVTHSKEKDAEYWGWLVTYFDGLIERYRAESLIHAQAIKDTARQLSNLWESRLFHHRKEFVEIFIQEFADYLAGIALQLQEAFVVAINKVITGDDAAISWRQFEDSIDQFSSDNKLFISESYREHFSQAYELYLIFRQNILRQAEWKQAKDASEVDDIFTIERVMTEVLSEETKRFLAQMHRDNRGYDSWLSHNGIRIPVGNRRQDVPEFRPDSPSLFDGSIYRGRYARRINWIAVALFDTLRPNLNVARNVVVSYPWRIYSNLLLAFAHAVKHTGLWRPHYTHDILPFAYFDEKFMLGEFLQDEHMKSDGDWPRLEVVRVEYPDGHHNYHNVEDIRQMTREGTVYLAPWQYTIRHGEPVETPLVVCRRAIIQLYLSAQIETITGSLVVDSAELPEQPQGLRLFAPFTFLPYKDSPLLRIRSMPWNMRHHFSEWLLENAVELDQRYPALYANLTSTLFAEVGKTDRYSKAVSPSEYVQNLEQALQKIRDIDEVKGIKPPPYVSLADFDFTEGADD